MEITKPNPDRVITIPMHLPTFLSPKDFEHDDLLLIKQKLGKTMCIVGGMPTNLLYYNSKEECIDYIKKVIGHVAVDGGFILSADKPMIGLTDGKLENFRAVNEFVHHYGVYRQEG